jgi:TPR repeat protein
VRGQGGLERSGPKALASWERGCIDGAHGQCCDFADIAQSVNAPPEGIRRSPARAMRMATRGCELEFAPSCYRLADAYLRGARPFETRKSGPKALAFMTKACDLGYGAACYNLAKMYHDGDIDGCPRDEEQSKRYAARTSEIERASRAAMGVPEP